MYSLDISEKMDKILSKLSKKNKKQYEIIFKKVEEILENPQHYKNLRSPMQHLKRVHIDKNYVLIFRVDENIKKVILEDYDHHDDIYNL